MLNSSLKHCYGVKAKLPSWKHFSRVVRFPHLAQAHTRLLDAVISKQDSAESVAQLAKSRSFTVTIVRRVVNAFLVRLAAKALLQTNHSHFISQINLQAEAEDFKLSADLRYRSYVQAVLNDVSSLDRFMREWSCALALEEQFQPQICGSRIYTKTSKFG